METLIDLEKSLDQFRQENDQLNEAQTLIRMGNYFLGQKKWPRAANSLNKSLVIFKENNQRAEQAHTLAYLGLVSWEQAQVQKAIDSFKLSLIIINEIKDTNGRKIVEAILGLSLWRKGDWTESLVLLKDVLPIDIGSIPDSYKILHNAIEKAVSQIQNRISAAQMNNNPLRTMQGHFTLAPLCLYMGYREEAKTHLLEAESLAKTLNDEKVLKTILSLRELIE
jgi:tetratricopeptide (TPR) repeat protein